MTNLNNELLKWKKRIKCSGTKNLALASINILARQQWRCPSPLPQSSSSDPSPQSSLLSQRDFSETHFLFLQVNCPDLHPPSKEKKQFWENELETWNKCSLCQIKVLDLTTVELICAVTTVVYAVALPKLWLTQAIFAVDALRTACWRETK